MCWQAETQLFPEGEEDEEDAEEAAARRKASKKAKPVYLKVSPTRGLGRVWKSRHLESRAKEEARMVLEVTVGWVSPSSRGLCLQTLAGVDTC